METSPIIRFEEANYSKGSHKKVVWTCPECATNFIKSYKSALKSKLCKSCNNKVRPKPDFSGKNNPFYGKSHSKAFKESISGSKNPNWSGGLPKCLDCDRKVKDRRAIRCSKCSNKGDQNPKWNPTYDRAKREHLRINEEYKSWAKSVKERDDFKCQHCGKVGGILHSHHLKEFSKYPDLRYNLDNGITLCKKCHIKVHSNS